MTPARTAPVVPARFQSEIPLSMGQRRLWFLEHMFPGTATYVLFLPIRLRGQVDRAALRRAVEELVARHSVLRSAFVRGRDGEPIQADGNFSTADLFIEERLVPGSDLAAAMSTHASTPFAIETGPLFTAVLTSSSDDDHGLLLKFHHAVCDGWSTGIILQELSELYDAYRTGRPPRLAEPPLQFSDYTIWEQGNPQANQDRVRAFAELYRDAPSLLPLPTDRARPAVQRFRGATFTQLIPTELAGGMVDWCRRREVTPFTGYLTGLHILLHRLTGASTVLIGTPVAGRSRLELERVVGFFVNTVVMRADIGENLTGAELLAQQRDRIFEVMANQDIRFEQIVDALELERNTSQNPLFQVLFAYQNSPRSPLRLTGLRAQFEEVGNDTAKFDLSVHVSEDPAGGLPQLLLEYNTDLFDAVTIEALGSRYLQVLTQLVSDDSRSVSRADLTLPQELAAARQINETGHPVLETKVVRLFEELAERRPDTTAVVQLGQAGQRQEFTYAAVRERVERRSDELTGAARAAGAGPGTVVAVHLPRSIDLVVTLLAIMRAGFIYCPVNPDLPPERIEFMLADSGATLIADIGGIRPGVAARPRQPGTGRAADEPIYLIYTSGSTGLPKGVLVAQDALINRLQWMRERYNVGPGDRILQKTSISFDVSLWELLLPLISGATLVLTPPGAERDLQQIARTLATERITLTHFVPSVLDSFLDLRYRPPMPDLRDVFCSGEVLSPATAAAFAEQVPARLHNLYGPTEAAIDVAAWPVGRADVVAGSVPIGRPVWNTQVHVLDRWLRSVPPGVPGELYLGGVQLALGYWGRPGPTAERFVAAPAGLAASGQRLYRTGDVVRRRADQVIEYLGRSDDQVKIRGHRIELGEVEQTLRWCPGVAEAAVVAAGPADHRQLVAYVVPTAERRIEDRASTLTANALARLRAALPDYMVPSALKAIDKLPRSSSGKIDRAALVAGAGPVGPDHITRGYRPPQNSRQRAIAEIWQDVLGQHLVGLDDDFFDLGGDSILSVRVVNRALDQGISVTVRDVFEHPTVARLAEIAEDTNDSRETHGNGLVPLLPAQRQAAQRQPWLHHRIYTADAWRVDILAEAMSVLTRRHEALRVTFDKGTSQLVRSVLDPEFGEGNTIAPTTMSARLDVDGALNLAVDRAGLDRRSLLQLVRELHLVANELRAGRHPYLPPVGLPYASACVDADRLPAGPTLPPVLPRPVRTVASMFTWNQLGGQLGTGTRPHAVKDEHLLLAAATHAVRQVVGRPVEVWVESDLRPALARKTGVNTDCLVGAFSWIDRLQLATTTEEVPLRRLEALKSALTSAAPADETESGGSDARPVRVVVSCLEAIDSNSDTIPEPIPASADTDPFDVRLLTTVARGALTTWWTVASDIPVPVDPTRLADEFGADLRTLITASEDETTGQFIAEDFPLARLTTAQLTELSERFPWAEDVYPPGPFQRHMLDRYARDLRGGLYVSWVHYTLDGIDLDVDAFAEAWRDVARRHTTLRTAFLWAGTDHPYSIVDSNPPVEVTVTDLTDLQPQEQVGVIEDFCEACRRRRIDLERPPLWTLSLFRTGVDSYEFIPQFTYLLQDGWSYWVFLDDLFEFYEARRRDEQPHLQPIRPYRDHISAIAAETADEAASHDAFWREHLAGATLPTPILPATATAVPGRYRRESEELAKRLELRLRSFARSHQLTLFTLFEAGWAAIVSALSGLDEAVIGVVSSGRSATLRGVQGMTGSFNNNLPVRVTLPLEADSLDWLGQVQATTRTIHQHEQSSLPDIRAAVGLGPEVNLFESYLVFENFPPGKRMDQVGREWTGNRDGATQTEHQLRLLIWPFGGLAVDVSFYDNDFAPSHVRRLLEAYLDILDGLTRTGRTVADIVGAARVGLAVPPTKGDS